MVFCEKYKGIIPRIVHSPAEWALVGREMKVSAACRASDGKVPDSLWVYVRRGEKYELKPCDSLTACGQKYEIYSGYIPKEEFLGSSVSYAVGEEGFFSELTDMYRVELIDGDTLPSQPPLILTEIYGRPKGRGIGTYLEVMNPSEKTVDLYDYEFLVIESKNVADGKPFVRLPMCDAPGTEYMKPGEFAAIWGITAANLDKKGRFWSSPEDFFEDFDSDFNNRFAGYTTADGRVVPVHLYTVSPETGEKKPLAGVGEIPVKNTETYLFIVPRGKNKEEAVYTAHYNTVYASCDTPVKQSSYWKTDVRCPDKGITICHYAPGTPGFAGRGQAYPDAAADLPLIIPMKPDTGLYISDKAADFVFAAVPSDPARRVTDAQVHICISDEEKVLEAYEREDGLWHAKLDSDFIARHSKLSYYLTASDGTRSVSTAGEKIEINIFDNEGPAITDCIPSEGYAYDGREKCEISARFYDISGVDLSECSLNVDGKDCTSGAQWSPAGVKYVTEFSTGSHNMSLELCDCLGNRSEKKINFTVSDLSVMNCYIGEVHCHTSDSDGTGFPPDAYEYARDVGKVDFFATTEHSHYIDTDKYRNAIETADRFDEPGKFSALYGWEMTWNNSCGYWGHINVLNTREFISDINSVSEPELWKWMKERPGCVGMFNHPGYSWGNFDEFSHRDDESDGLMQLAEIKGPVYDFEYMNMLAEGWHCSPVTNEDNHAPNWTTATNMYGMILAPALTRQNVVDAFVNHRTYTTSDRTMKILYKVNGEWLGSHLDNPDKLRFDISITTEALSGIGLVEIVTEDNIVAASKDFSGIRTVNWKPVLNADFDYYYVRITGMGNYCVTAPVWLENRGEAVISGIQYAASYNETDSAAVSAVIENKTAETLDDVRVSFILSAQNGFRLADAEPFRRICCGKMKAGSSLKVSALLPEIPYLRRATVIVSAKNDGKRRSSTAYAMLNPVQITATMPESAVFERDGKEFENPFAYITLYNRSPKPVSLSGARLCLWTKTGKQPSEDRKMTFGKFVLQPRSTVVVWDRSQNPELTVNDFNERYGTAFVEGVTIIPTSVHIIGESKDGRRLDLRFGDVLREEIISRVHWNYALEFDGAHHEEVEHRYVYVPNRTSTSTPSGFRRPQPGAVDEEQAGIQRTVLPGRKDKKRAQEADKKDARAEKRKENAVLSKKEGAIAAAGAAAVGAGLAATLAVLFKKKK